MDDAVTFAQYIDSKYGLVGLVLLGVFAFVFYKLLKESRKKAPPKDAGAAVDSVLGEVMSVKAEQERSRIERERDRAEHAELSGRVRSVEILAVRLDERTK